jgi:hypothetical protein
VPPLRSVPGPGPNFQQFLTFFPFDTFTAENAEAAEKL